MAESPTADIATVAQTLEELYQLVSSNSVQPVHQFAEHAVVYWMRVVEGTDVLLPRLNREGYVPDAFHFCLEPERGNRLDADTPGLDAEQCRDAFAPRLAALREKLEQYFHQSGYRGSSEHCDQIMMEVNLFSRFLSGCCLESELAARPDGAGATPGGAATIADGAGARPGGHEAAQAEARKKEVALRYTRGNLFTLEPVLNDVIVSWEQNSLSDFDRVLRELAALIDLPEPERGNHAMPPGYPLRPHNRPRSKVTVVNPVLRPLRTKSMFLVRHGQLARRIAEMGSLRGGLAEGLTAEMRHFITMIRGNHFMLASEPSFWVQHRAGLPLIRGQPTSHPFLHDPLDFFKKAVMFHNRTYTVAGGGVDRIFLQIKQLERYFKFHSPVGARSIRRQLDACLRGWEENRWDAFTEGLLQFAEWLRARAEAGTA